MNSRMLPAVLENAEYDIEHCLQFVVDGLGGAKLLFRLCNAYRRRGLCSLFLRGSAAALHQDLQRAGAAFAFALERDASFLRAASKAAPFYDAVSCRDQRVAEQIAALLPETPAPEEEYEEDHCFISVIACLVRRSGPADQLNRLLGVYRELAATSHDRRFEVCEALVTRSSDQFGIAMDHLLNEREDDVNQSFDFDEITEDEWATGSQFFVEGLATVRVAQMLGIRTDDNYLFIPSLAVESSAEDLSPMSWKQPFNYRMES
jgi:hypothetical protein